MLLVASVGILYEHQACVHKQGQLDFSVTNEKNVCWHWASQVQVVFDGIMEQLRSFKYFAGFYVVR